MSCLLIEEKSATEYFLSEVDTYLTAVVQLEELCGVVLTQPRPSRGFYVIRTFYFWCKQSFTCSTCLWTGDGALHPPSRVSGRAILQFTRRSSDAARKDVRWYPITTTLRGVFGTLIYEIKARECSEIDCFWLVMDCLTIRWVHSEIWDILKEVISLQFSCKTVEDGLHSSAAEHCAQISAVVIKTHLIRSGIWKRTSCMPSV